MNALWVIVFFAVAADMPVEVRVTLDPPEIPFHRQARFTVSVEGPAGQSVELPKIAEKFGGLEIHGAPRRNTEPLWGGRSRVTETYTLEAVFIGNYPIRPIEVKLGDGDTVVVPSPALRVRDLTDTERAAAERFEPNAGLITLRAPFWRWWPFWAGLGGVLALGIAVGVYAYRWKRQREKVVPPAPPWEIAYARLRALDQEHLPQAGGFERYYVELSAILREYIEARFHVHAPEQTTPEFLAEAARSGLFAENQQRQLAHFLRHSDRVKFARLEPTVAEMERSFAEVLRFVDETVPAAEPPKEAAA